MCRYFLLKMVALILFYGFFAFIVAEKLGSTSPPPYLSLNPYDDAILKGVNYASGGAGILNDTGLYFVRFIIIIIFYLFI